MSITIDLREFEDAFATLLAGLRSAAHQALMGAVDAAHESARTTDLFKDGPDRELRKSLTKGIDGPMSGFIRAGAKHARWVEDGTAPHDIRPKRASVLRFQIAGRACFSRMVHHPGTHARPFMARAAAIGEQTLDYGLEYLTERPIMHFNAGG